MNNEQAKRLRMNERTYVEKPLLELVKLRASQINVARLLVRRTLTM